MGLENKYKELFLENKYTEWYFRIIERSLVREKPNGYFEKHHIIPVSLGGDHDSSNISVLTAREHYICHLLLVKMVRHKGSLQKMIKALVRFGGVENHQIYSKSRSFSLLREIASKNSMGDLNYAYGRIWCINKQTGKRVFIKKEEFDGSIYKKGLNQQIGGFSGYIWINNKFYERMIPHDKDVPKGWFKGRIKSPDIYEKMISMSKKRHTKEKDLEHSRKMKGRIGVVNKNGDYKKIKEKDLQKYIEMGYLKKKCS